MADIKIFAKNLEESAQKQVEFISKQPPFVDSQIRIMPDAHGPINLCKKSLMPLDLR